MGIGPGHLQTRIRQTDGRPKSDGSRESHARCGVAPAGRIAREIPEKAALPRAPEAGQRAQKDTAQREHASKKADTKSAEKAALKASAALEKEKDREARDRAKAEAQRAREIRQRELVIAKANTVFERARSRHEDAMNSIRQRRAELDKEEADEDKRWELAQQAHDASLKEAKP